MAPSGAFFGSLHGNTQPDFETGRLLRPGLCPTLAALTECAGGALTTMEAAASVRLEPMPADAFVRFRQDSIRSYAAEHVRAGDWTEAEAPMLALKAMENLLPVGLATEGHEFFEIIDAQVGGVVGLLWYARRERAGESIAYVYDIQIQPEFRRKGHARAAFLALERRVAAQGMRGISLHVFGHNSGAHALYASLGYHDTHVSMFKPLPG
jgi:ribosomal protein S18 acetylase RimI-like enzyme